MKPWEIGMLSKKQKKAKRKVQKNGFYYYMLDYNIRHLGGKLNDFQKLQELAGPSWKAMDPEARSPFEIKANKARNNCSDEARGNLGTSGSLVEIQEQQKLKSKLMQEAIEDIEQTIDALDAETTLQTKEFFICHANSHVRTLKDGVVVPCEVAICKYTIKDGVIDTYEKILNIRPIPRGYAADAMQNSEATHKIPTPAEGLGETNAELVFREILKFMLPDMPIDTLNLKELHKLPVPPMYTVKSVAELTFECFRAIMCCCFPPTTPSGEPYLDMPIISVYPIEVLLMNILKLTVKSVRIGNVDVPEEAEAVCFSENDSLIYAKFHNDPYSHAPEIACKFHAEVDCLDHCSRSWVIRMTYTISDYCCNLLGVKRRVWRHFPVNRSITYRTNMPVFLSKRPQVTEIRTDASISSEEQLDNFEIPIEPIIVRHGLPVALQPPNDHADHNWNPTAGRVEEEELPLPIIQHPLRDRLEKPMKTTFLQPAASVPPTMTSILSSSDDDDDASVHSYDSVSTLKSLNTSKDFFNYWAKSSQAKNAQSRPTIKPADKEPVLEKCYGRGQYLAAKFNMESTPEVGYLRSRSAQAHDEVDRESVHSHADSFVSTPLERYRKPTEAKSYTPNLQQSTAELLSQSSPLLQQNSTPKTVDHLISPNYFADESPIPLEPSSVQSEMCGQGAIKRTTPVVAAVEQVAGGVGYTADYQLQQNTSGAMFGMNPFALPMPHYSSPIGTPQPLMAGISYYPYTNMIHPAAMMPHLMPPFNPYTGGQSVYGQDQGKKILASHGVLAGLEKNLKDIKF
ncbi:uncharacterized protein LOC132195320 isoform X2 [Neocloeon triangulifer]|uniref:uncharacterized protein LOC132195320 isoform X2 n=1 Tax=Neocloeon triangulifer TaxID=2078957 RepID=UPI00286F87F5|nr:uncharacterized protein LOC132195320 isoform X2 [Neocloeon triangulifer]